MDKDELLHIIEQAATDGVTSLDLSNRGLTELPPEIGKLTNLTKLYLRYNQLSMLPLEIGKLINLTRLDLGYNQLTELPPEIGKLTNLTWLFLRGVQLTALPSEIWKLTKLKRLELAHNQLIVLPPEIGKLINLSWFGLGNNQISTLPSEIGSLRNLWCLLLASNQLATLPPEIGMLTNLGRLDLRDNQLTTLPPEIEKLTNLTRLELRGNLLPIISDILELTREPAKIIESYLLHQTELEKKMPLADYAEKEKAKSHNLSNRKLTTIPPKIWQIADLVELDLGYNQLATLSSKIGKLTNLRTLRLHNNQLTTLPPEIGELLNLTTLRLGGNQLTMLPSEIWKLTNIDRFDVEYNKLTMLSPEVGRLTNLTGLYLKHNQLTTLPIEIWSLRNLGRLELGYNQITMLPREIGELMDLKYLELQNNDLTELPPEIGKLTNLKELNLRDNQLTILPSEIRNLTNLTFLNLKGNPLPIPPEILALTGQPQKILNYYFQYQKQQKKPLNEPKVVIVGQGAVGKTSLVKRLLEDKFDPYETKTEGIDIKQWNINVPSTGPSTGSGRTEVRLNVWDFGGQEIMHATHQFFLTKRSLYLLVLDSRLEEQENRVEYWLKIIQSFGGDSPIIVVCNKCDEHDLELNWKGLQEKYPSIKDFAKRVSCKTGEGISDLRALIGQEVGQLEHIYDELLLTWFEVKKQLEQMKENYISYSKYQKMCEAENVADELSQQTLLGFLHDLGIVLSFHGHYILEDTNVLNPEWVTRGIYQILNSNELFQRKGVLERKALDHILDSNEYPRSKHQFIIDMMRKFELCFDFAESTGERFLVPDLLSKEEPFTGEWDDSLAFHYHYDILPGSVISRFIVRMHAFIFKKTYWRNGVVLVSENGKNKALVKADIEDKKIFIYVAGKKETRSTFLEVIRADFHRIHKSISKLNVKEKVPVPGHPNVVVDHEHLLTLEELDEETFIPEGLRVKVNVKELLYGLAPIPKKETPQQVSVLEKDFREEPAQHIGERKYEHAEENMAYFRWLHLTDLHCGMKDQHWLWPDVRDIFFKDLERLHEKNGPWDLVLFTGDLTQRGSAEEFQKVDELLEQLWEFFNKLGSVPKLLTVPGNHDLVRPNPKDPSVRLLQQWLNFPDIREEFWEEANSSYRQVVTQVFEPYVTWWEQCPFTLKGVNAGILPGDFATTFETGGAKLGIVGLNTSFLQLSDADYEGKLALHSRQFHGVCNGDGPAWVKQHHACLLLSHHPPAWLSQAAQQYLYEEIVAHGRFVAHLCGHAHETAYREIAEGGSETCRTWQGHSLFGLEYFGEDDEGQRLHGYAAGRIELSQSMGTLLFWPREARLQGRQRRIVPDFSLNLTDNQHTPPGTFDLLQPLSR